MHTISTPTWGVGSPKGSSNNLTSSPRRGHTSFKQQPDSPKAKSGGKAVGEVARVSSPKSKSTAAPPVSDVGRTYSSASQGGKTSSRTISACLLYTSPSPRDS
eukprot:TRINITY_DN44065_c0_g2_i1.p2 TRINITY_DN44065_c0_g2~~TRINITY_DN44065_c0_g2_i1.p2  ORF type:complete len:103 (-),score=16.88 TRINITY_DN44065_c0_g2_i1:103-411(-)